MTTSATNRGGASQTWTRAKIIERIQRWVSLYGEPPRSADWNPSAARWSAADWRIERYRAGDPDTGEPWPSLNAAKKLFGGSITAANVAAGFEPNRTGPPRRKDVHPTHVLDSMPPAARVALEGALRELELAHEQVAVRDGQLARAREANTALRSRLERPRRPSPGPTRTKTITKTKTVKVTDDAALDRLRARAERDLERAERKVADARAAETAARRDAAEARTHATKAASKLERAEGTISDLRGERRDLTMDSAKANDRATAAERMLADARAEAHELRNSKTIIEKDAPEQAVIDAAEVRARRAELAMAESERRAAKAEREHAEVAAAVVGEQRRLTPTELAALKSAGPSGPALLTAAIRELAKARVNNNRTALAKALTSVASAAVSWRERL